MLVRGVAAIPAGRERASECAARRARIAVWIEEAQHLLETVKKELRDFAAQKPDSDGTPSLEFHRHWVESLRWAIDHTNAAQTAARTLETLDSFETPELEYSELSEQLCITKEALRGFTGVMLDSGKAAVSRLERTVKPAAFAPVDKLHALPDTCSSASDSRSPSREPPPLSPKTISSGTDTGAVVDQDRSAAASVPGGVAEVCGFSAGESVEVWSNGRGEWLPCLIRAVFPQEVEADGFTIPPSTIKVQFEAGSKTKYIREGGILREMRRAASGPCKPLAFTGLSRAVSRANVLLPALLVSA